MTDAGVATPRWTIPVVVVLLALLGVVGGGVAYLSWPRGSAEVPPDTTSAAFVATGPTPSVDAAPAPAVASQLDASPARAEDASLVAVVDGSSADAAPSEVARSPRRAGRSLRARGWLRVATRPHYAEVYVDGRRRGSTPLLVQVPVGRRRVRLVNPQVGRSERRAVTVSAANTRAAPAVVSLEGF